MFAKENIQTFTPIKKLLYGDKTTTKSRTKRAQNVLKTACTGHPTTKILQSSSFEEKHASKIIYFHLFSSHESKQVKYQNELYRSRETEKLRFLTLK